MLPSLIICRHLQCVYFAVLFLLLLFLLFVFHRKSSNSTVVTVPSLLTSPSPSLSLCFPILQPRRLLSPDTVLRRRKANSFELATLLCSYLIGNGFAACVVSGYATREIVNNDQRRVACPYVPLVEEEEEEGKGQVRRWRYFTLAFELGSSRSHQLCS